MSALSEADRGLGGGLRDVIPAVATGTAVALPSFLVGALAVQIRQHMNFSLTTLGFIVASFQMAAAVVSVPSTVLVRRLGALRVLRLSPVVAAVVLMAVAGLVTTWPVLAAMMVVAGAASATAQPAANLLLARRIPVQRQGLAFGIKQSAVPLAGLLAGLAIPFIALSVGWRWAFALAAVVAMAASFAASGKRRVDPDTVPRVGQRRRTQEPLRPLVVLAVGFGFALAAASSLAAFLVPSGVTAGLGKGTAGVVASLAAAAAVAMRVAAGQRADRRGESNFPAVVALIVVGAVGFALLATGSGLHRPVMFIPGAILAYGVGWGWNGLFNLAVVQTHPGAPARATAAIQTGGCLGNVIGPILLGVLADRFGYEVAWALAVIEALLGATMILVGWRLLKETRLEPLPRQESLIPPQPSV